VGEEGVDVLDPVDSLFEGAERSVAAGVGGGEFANVGMVDHTVPNPNSS